MSDIIDKIIENGKIIQYEELETEHGVFTSNVEQQLTAQEVYEKWLYDRENPSTPELSIEDKISILKEKNEQQDEIINIQLLATDELYMMVEPLLNMEIQTFDLGGNRMVDMYVAMVQRGLKTIDEVPVRYREQVREILEQLEK